MVNWLFRNHLFYKLWYYITHISVKLQQPEGSRTSTFSVSYLRMTVCQFHFLSIGSDNIVAERLSFTLHSCEANRESFFWTLLDLSADPRRAIRYIIHSFQLHHHHWQTKPDIRGQGAAVVQLEWPSLQRCWGHQLELSAQFQAAQAWKWTCTSRPGASEGPAGPGRTGSSATKWRFRPDPEWNPSDVLWRVDRTKGEHIWGFPWASSGYTKPICHIWS